MSEEEKKEAVNPTEAPAAEATPAKEKEPEQAKAQEETPAPESVEEGAPEEAKEEKAGAPTAADLLKTEVDLNVRKAKGSKNVTSGTVTILATFNNTKVTFSDPKGNVISWSSAGKMNFRGSRKSTAYAAQVVTQDAGKVALSHGMKEVEIRVKGPGMGRDSAIRAVQSLGMNVTSIVDITPVPHNGCRPKKRRRV